MRLCYDLLLPCEAYLTVVKMHDEFQKRPSCPVRARSQVSFLVEAETSAISTCFEATAEGVSHRHSPRGEDGISIVSTCFSYVTAGKDVGGIYFLARGE